MKRKKGNKVIRHLKGDIKMFKHEANEDRNLIKSLRSLGPKKKKHAGMSHAMEERLEERVAPGIHKKIKALSKKKHKKDPKKSSRYSDKYSRKAEDKIHKVMHEFGQGELHSGSKKGPKVKSRKQALAIAINSAKREGLKAGRRKKKK